MDYFGPPVYPSDYAPPFADHLHERAQPHPSLLQYLTHRKPNMRPPVYVPDVDIRDTATAYYLDIELPGLSDKNSTKLEWTSSRSLFVSGEIQRPYVEPTPGEPETAETGTRDQDGNWVPSKETGPIDPTLVVTERRIGPFRRHFNFPVDVDMKKLKAKLENGLLSVYVPKKKPSEGNHSGRVSIE